MPSGTGDSSIDRRGIGNPSGGAIRRWETGWVVGRISALGVWTRVFVFDVFFDSGFSVVAFSRRASAAFRRRVSFAFCRCS